MRVGLVPVTAVAVALALTGCGTEEPGGPAASIRLSSDAFADGELIPPEHTCDGADTPPPLAWHGVPDDAAELAVLVTDPDARGGEFVHWVVAGLDPHARELAGDLPEGAVEGSNDFGGTGWGGPCPPAGDDPHRYVFTVHAAGVPRDLAPGASADDLRSGLEAAELARGQLVGTYDR